MSCEIRDRRFVDAIGEALEIERVLTGFRFTEGPAWHPYEKHLTFSDIPASRIHRWSANSGLTTFREPSNKTNGNTYDREGRLLSCEHAASVVSRTAAGGAREVLLSHYEGRELNSPNDVVVARSGAIYFSDPSFGRMNHPLQVGEPREQQLPWQAVFRFTEADGLTPLITDFGQPNGLCLDRDERHLFVNDTPRRHIRRWRLREDGGVEGGEVFAELTGEGEGVPDGLKIDSDGTLFCTGPGGIHAFAQDGTCLGVIRVPEKTANFAWGGDDLRTLYMTASSSLYRVRVKTPGLALF